MRPIIESILYLVQLTKKELQRAGGFGASVPAC